MFFHRLSPWMALALIFGFAALLRLPIAAIPLERDEGEYAYIGERWLTHGEIPYQSSFDQKPPAAFLIYGLILKTLGRSPSAIHWGAQLFSLATLASFYFLVRRLFTPQIALISGLLCVVMMTDHTVLGNAANTEIFMLLPSVVAMWTALRARDRESVIWSLITGAMSAVAICCKQVALPNLLLCTLVVGAAPFRRWLKLGAILLGATAVLAPFCLYFWAAGAWCEFYDCVLGHNLAYASQVSLPAYPILFWMSFSKILASCWPIYLFAMFGLISALPQFRQLQVPPRHRQILLAALWLAFSLAGAAVGGIFRNHYFIQILPCIALLAAIGVHWFTGHLRIPRLAWIATLVLLYYPIGVSLGYYLPGSPLEKSRRIYGLNPFAESPEAARFIASNSAPDDTVFILGSEPQILFYAQRRSATRYIFSYPLTMPFPDARQRQNAAIEEVRHTHPRFVVTVFVRTSLQASQDTPEEIFRFTRSLLKESYELAAATPVNPYGAAHLVTGAEVRERWRQSPVWYDTRSWCSLAIWRRIDKGAP